MPFFWDMPLSWVTTFITAGVGFLPVLLAGGLMVSPSSRSSPAREVLQYEEGVLRWEDEQARRGCGGMCWMLDWEYFWGDDLLDKKRGVRYDVSVSMILGTLGQADFHISGWS
jgi:hypothetical protein